MKTGIRIYDNDSGEWGGGKEGDGGKLGRIFVYNIVGNWLETYGP